MSYIPSCSDIFRLVRRGGPDIFRLVRCRGPEVTLLLLGPVSAGFGRDEP